MPSARTSSLFAALRVANFRLYFAGQAVSLVGTWMQSIAIAWLVLELGGSGSVLGGVVAVQFLPVLAFGAAAGLLVDRRDKRRLLLGTQAAFAGLALALGLIVEAGVARLWIVFIFAALFGCVNAVDSPARQTFVTEMVGSDRIQNAVSLNSSLVSASRAIGPALAGALIAVVGVGVCFLANAASFLAVLAALAAMDVGALHRSKPVPRAAGQLREGLRHVRSTPALLVPLLMMALIGTLAYEFQVVLPLLAQDTFAGGSETFGLMTAASGVGAVFGGLWVASRRATGLLPLTGSAVLFGVALAGAALAPTLVATIVALALVGVGGTAFLATGNSSLQLAAEPRYRGRVMALWSVTFLGSTPIGGPIVGAVCEWLSPRAGLALGAVACLLAAALGAVSLHRLPPDERIIEAPEPPTPAPPTVEVELPKL
ncbi:MAG TPA: MFS transporter [Solirubrobacterales bacterium]|nr:MFS transporter [Solirubrobacterales bacterium]